MNARSTDPISSHLAAAEMVDSGEQDRQCQIVLKLVRRCPGHTCSELAAFCVELDRHQIARRLPDLRTAGKVRNGVERPCSVSGRTQCTWHPVQAGEQRNLF